MNNDIRSITNLNIDTPEGMAVEAKLVSIEQKPRYYRIGNGIRNTFMGKEHSPMDAIDEMAKMSTRELWVIKILKDNLILKEEKINGRFKKRTSCLSVVLNSSLTNPEQQKFKAGFKRLKESNLVKRIKREHYILNPDFLIPHFYDEEKILWNSI